MNMTDIFVKFSTVKEFDAFFEAIKPAVDKIVKEYEYDFKLWCEKYRDQDEWDNISRAMAYDRLNSSGKAYQETLSLLRNLKDIFFGSASYENWDDKEEETFAEKIHKFIEDVEQNYCWGIGNTEE